MTCQNEVDRGKMALNDQDLAKMLMRLREKMPEMYRHIIGLIQSLLK